jgi:ribose 5-phosphate isomerase B
MPRRSAAPSSTAEAELIVGRELAGELVRVYLAARYGGGERHQRRLDKIRALERRYGAPG